MYEDLLMLMPDRYRASLQVRIAAGCTLSGACQVWQKSCNGSGYPQIKVSVRGWGCKPVQVHQLVFLMYSGIIPPSHQVSHICHNKKCVELAHLSAEPPAVNCQRNTCLREQQCFGHSGWPDCLFVRIFAPLIILL